MFYIWAVPKESICKLRTACVACVMSLNINLVSPKLSGICPLPTLLSICFSITQAQKAQPNLMNVKRVQCLKLIRVFLKRKKLRFTTYQLG